MYARLDEHELALACAREAAQRDPNSFDVQYALAMRLLDQSEFVEAERILYWCLQRRPNDASLENRWKLALKHKLDNPHHAGARKDGVMR